MWYRFGEFVDGPLTAEDVRSVVEQAKTLRAAYRRVPLEEILEILHALGQRLADPEHPIRRRVLEQMPDIVRFHPSMVAEGLDSLCGMLDRQNILIRMRSDLGGTEVLERFTYQEPFEGSVKAEPRGVVAHVAAGNVFVGAIDSLIQGLVTKNVNLLKMSGVDPVFPLLFTEALHEVDTEHRVSQAYALLPFRGGDKEVEEILKQGCDTIIVYGGEDAVAAYRDGMPITNRVVEYGPKYSLMVLDAALIDGDSVKKIARDFTLWEQSACSSPHVIYVVGGADKARDLALALSAELEGMLAKFPLPDIRRDEAVEITRTRELARVSQALGEGELFVPAEGQGYTVIFEEDPGFRVSCQHRTAYVKPVARFDEVLEILKPYGTYIQSVGILAGPGAMHDWGDRLVEGGADRITDLGEMTRRKHGTPHDGTKGLAEFVRWTSIGGARKFDDHFDFLPDAERDRVTLARLNALLARCREGSSFYRERIPERPLRSLEELASIPAVNPHEYREHLPPDGSGILTGPIGTSYSFGSGGTTGKPKFVYRTVPETLANARALGKGLFLSGFARRGDVVGNLLFAGNLWASFVSLNQALEQTGAHILPIGGHIDLEAQVNLLRAFKANAALTIPSILISIAQYVKRHGIDDLKLTRLAYGGEHLFPEARRQLAEVLGAERIVSAGYAANDTGAIGFQDETCEGGVHLVHEDIHIVEILDLESGEPITEPGKAGKIVVTNVSRHLMPTIRFEVGDLGAWVERPERGRRLRRFDLLGRSDEVLIVGGFNVSLEMVAGVLAQVPGLSGHFRMLGRSDGMLDQLVIETESEVPLPAEQSGQLEARILEVLQREKKEFATWLATGAIAAPVARVLGPDELPRNPRTGKIKQVVEER
jgi:phenylacetate-coenzyme A ligase PaaK-like adenylate-forming protein